MSVAKTADCTGNKGIPWETVRKGGVLNVGHCNFRRCVKLHQFPKMTNKFSLHRRCIVLKIIFFIVKKTLTTILMMYAMLWTVHFQRR
jgi:GTP-dependent phosphoenolpyruvate carboxykinase